MQNAKSVKIQLYIFSINVLGYCLATVDYCVHFHFTLHMNGHVLRPSECTRWKTEKSLEYCVTTKL